MNDTILARGFAMADATEQALMIDAFARELFVQCGGRFRKDSKYGAGYDHQCCNISGKLTKDGTQFIKDLYAFIELRERDI